MSRAAALEYLARVRDDPLRVAAALKALYAAGLIEGDEPIVAEALERQSAAFALRGSVDRVLVARPPVRHDGTAVAAVVTRSEATDVLYHHVGASGAGLSTPALTDDLGTRYAPAHWNPVSADGMAAAVYTGTWRYLPAAPAGARQFTITRGDAWWTVGD